MKRGLPAGLLVAIALHGCAAPESREPFVMHRVFVSVDSAADQAILKGMRDGVFIAAYKADPKNRACGYYVEDLGFTIKENEVKASHVMTSLAWFFPHLIAPWLPSRTYELHGFLDLRIRAPFTNESNGQSSFESLSPQRLTVSLSDASTLWWIVASMAFLIPPQLCPHNLNLNDPSVMQVLAPNAAAAIGKKVQEFDQSRTRLLDLTSPQHGQIVGDQLKIEGIVHGNESYELQVFLDDSADPFLICPVNDMNGQLGASMPTSDIEHWRGGGDKHCLTAILMKKAESTVLQLQSLLLETR